MDNLKRGTKALTTLTQSLGWKSPMIGLESLSIEDMSLEIKKKSLYAIETFGGEIRKLVKEYSVFEPVCRQERTEQFISDIRSINDIVNPERRPFVDPSTSLVSDDVIAKQRAPLSQAYLNVFNAKVDSKLVVTADDFWKCLDMNGLYSDLHKSDFMNSVSKLFTDDMSVDNLNRTANILKALNAAVANMSTDYENAIVRTINAYMSGSGISAAERLDFSANTSTLCGVVITTEIADVVNRKWYKSNLSTNIADMMTNTKVLLEEPYIYIRPSRDVNTKCMQNLMAIADDGDAYATIKMLEREVGNIVDNVILSVRRIERLNDNIISIPEKDNDGLYNDGLRDLSLVIAIYICTLNEVVKYAIETAHMVNDSFKAIHALRLRIDSVNVELAKYIQLRSRK